METGQVTWIKVEVDLIVDGKPTRYVVSGEPGRGIRVNLDPRYIQYNEQISLLDSIDVTLEGTLVADCTMHANEPVPPDIFPGETYPQLRAL